MCRRPRQNLRLLQLSAQHDSEDDEPLRMFDPNVVEVRNIQGIIARRTVRVDDAFRLDYALHEGWFKAVEQRIRQGAGPGNVVMVTHRPNIEVLTMELIAPAELVVVTADEDGNLEVIGRITLAEAP